MGPTSDVVVEEAAKVQEPPPAMATVADSSDNIHIVDIHEEEVIDYEGSGREELAKLSSEDDDAWDSAVDTSLKHDTSKFSYLSAEDLKVINVQETDTFS